MPNAETSTTKPEWATVAEVSVLTGIPKPTLYEHCRKGSLKTLPQIGVERRVPASEIARLNEWSLVRAMDEIQQLRDAEGGAA